VQYEEKIGGILITVIEGEYDKVDKNQHCEGIAERF
jgi:hypothetical protein